MQPKTMATRVIDRLIVTVYGLADPSDAEWTGHLELLGCQGIERTTWLIVSAGGEPTPTQRRRLNELLAGRTVPVAVVSGSLRVRGTVTALSWFNPRARAFAPADLREAIAYLEIPATRVEFIERAVARLRAELEDARSARRGAP